MTDINESLIDPAALAPRRSRAAARRPRRQPAAELLAFAELLFFAYRDFTQDADAILQEFGFGRAHHRVLHFVNRHPGLRVADLLDILKITKQSLGRVLKQLIDKGYVVQKVGGADRRERLLFTTDAGRALAKRLASPQAERLAQALDAAGQDGIHSIRTFLSAMIDAEERPKVTSIMDSASDAAAERGSAEGV